MVPLVAVFGGGQGGDGFGKGTVPATVLSQCVIGEGALIAAGALVWEGVHVPPHTLWAGCPARQIRELTPDQRRRLEHTYRYYVNAATARRVSGRP